MKLRNIYMACKRSVEPIRNVHIYQNTTSTTRYWVSGWNDAQTAILNNLKGIELFEEKIAAFINTIPQALITRNEFEVSSSDWTSIKNRHKELLISIQDVIDLYESMGFEENSAQGIDIKLPECKDFQEFRKCIDELDFILYKCPFFKSDEEHLQFESMDVGSLWITILAVSAVGVSASVLLNNIAAFIDKCYVIKSHQLTIKQQEVIYENMKIDQKTKEQYLDGLKLVYDQIVKSTVVELEEITNIKLEDGEQVGIVSQAFDKTISLLDKGLQIYTTIDTPKEVQNLFEPLEMKYVDVAKPIEKIVQKEE
jgi:hypothetical protein